MVTTVDISEKFDVPNIENPSEFSFQVKRMINISANRHVISGFKDAYRSFKINKNGNLSEKQNVHDSITGALNKDRSTKLEWVDSTMDFEALIITTSDHYSYTYVMKGSNGVVESIDLVSKELTSEDEYLSGYHDTVLGYL